MRPVDGSGKGHVELDLCYASLCVEVATVAVFSLSSFQSKLQIWLGSKHSGEALLQEAASPCAASLGSEEDPVQQWTEMRLPHTGLWELA